MPGRLLLLAAWVEKVDWEVKGWNERVERAD